MGIMHDQACLDLGEWVTGQDYMSHWTGRGRVSLKVSFWWAIVRVRVRFVF